MAEDISGAQITRISATWAGEVVHCGTVTHGAGAKVSQNATGSGKGNPEP